MDPGKVLLLPPPPLNSDPGKFLLLPPPPPLNPFGQNWVCPPKWMLARTPMRVPRYYCCPTHYVGMSKYAPLLWTLPGNFCFDFGRCISIQHPQVYRERSHEQLPRPVSFNVFSASPNTTDNAMSNQHSF